jgi:hypothetical protein
MEKMLKFFIYTSITLVFTYSLLLFPGATGAYAQSDEDDSEDFLQVGGALRFNLLHRDFEGGTDANSTQFTFDTWRINILAEHSGVGINFEYRFYPTFNTHFIKQGWFEHGVTDKTTVQVGVTQVPFGNLQYNSHNWWFQGPYYVGLEDDHDMGIKVIHKEEKWDLMVAYFIQPEPSGPANGEASFGIGGSGRYSYDMIPTEGFSNQEKQQGNIRYSRLLSHGNGSTEIGGSVMYGGIYNSALDDFSDRSALAFHWDGNYGNWNILGQFTYYNFNALNDDGTDAELINVGAYGIPYDIASEAAMYSLGIAYSWNVDFGPVSNLTFYDDYTFMDKANSSFNESHQNVLGMLATVGNMFIYFDLASGLNHPWLTSDFGVGMDAGVDDPRFNSRFNINIGYYF